MDIKVGIRLSTVFKKKVIIQLRTVFKIRVQFCRRYAQQAGSYAHFV